MRKTTIALAIGGVVLFGGAALPQAHADTISSIGDDSYRVTCKVLGEMLDGFVTDDTGTATGVAAAIAKEYGIDIVTAARVENYQVQNYCPVYWPNLVAVGKRARGEY